MWFSDCIQRFLCQRESSSNSSSFYAISSSRDREYFSSWRAFGQKSRENGQIHPTLLANLQTTTKRRNQVALKTILITVVIFCISYVPVVLRSVHSLGMQGGAKKWLLFVDLSLSCGELSKCNKAAVSEKCK